MKESSTSIFTSSLDKSKYIDGNKNEDGGAKCDSTTENGSVRFKTTMKQEAQTTAVSEVSEAEMVVDSFVDGFDRQLCQANFCVSGVDGFTSFQNALISWVYGYSMWLGMVCIVSWFFLKCIWGCNCSTVCICSV